MEHLQELLFVVNVFHNVFLHGGEPVAAGLHHLGEFELLSFGFLHEVVVGDEQGLGALTLLAELYLVLELVVEEVLEGEWGWAAVGARAVGDGAGWGLLDVGWAGTGSLKHENTIIFKKMMGGCLKDE